VLGKVKNQSVYVSNLARKPFLSLSFPTISERMGTIAFFTIKDTTPRWKERELHFCSFLSDKT
jgi:hypothetical protein